jgi:hypothetical protein
MRVKGLLIALALLIPTATYADSPVSAKRDTALTEIAACLRRNEVSSRQCKNLNKDISILEDLYRQGDKTVLPTLLQFTYLADFYRDSLIDDPGGFLSAISHLSEQAQQSIATSIAGGLFGVAQPRFIAIRTTLTQIPESSPIYQIARKYLVTLETDNALFLADYFPPQTFAADPRSFRLRWYSAELHALGEIPLSEFTRVADAEVYRLMILPTWGNPIAVRVYKSGNLYHLSARRTDGQAGFDPGKSVEAKDVDLDVDDSKTFEGLLKNLNFFKLPTDDDVHGFDGDEWILEGVSEGRYHVVDRWCATSYNPQKRGLTAFVALCKFLVDKSKLSERPNNRGHKLM